MSDPACVCDPLTMFDQPFIPFIGSFGVCAYTTSDIISFIFGYCNLLCWLFVHIPQLYSSFKNKSGGALSPVMIGMWLAGDLCGLLGLALTGQTGGPMLVSQCYYLTLDLLIVCQALYFTYFGPNAVGATADSYNFGTELDNINTVNGHTIQSTSAHNNNNIIYSDDVIPEEDLVPLEFIPSSASQLQSTSPISPTNSLTNHNITSNSNTYRLSQKKTNRHNTSSHSPPFHSSTQMIPANQPHTLSMTPQFSPSYSPSNSQQKTRNENLSLESTNPSSISPQFLPQSFHHSQSTTGLGTGPGICTGTGMKLSTNPANPSAMVLIVMCIFTIIGAHSTEAFIHRTLTPLLHQTSAQTSIISSTTAFISPIITLSTATPPLCSGGTQLAPWQSILGITLAWVCFCIYAPSRLPQIYLNWKRKSVAGIALPFVAVPVLANIFYISSVFISSANAVRTNNFTSGAFWSGTFPYVFFTFLGMVATLVILYQMWLYRETPNGVVYEEFQEEEVDENGNFVHNQSISNSSCISSFQRNNSNMSTSSKLNQTVGGLAPLDSTIIEGDEEEDQHDTDNASMLGSYASTISRQQTGHPRSGSQVSRPRQRGLIGSESTIALWHHSGIIEVPSFLTSRSIKNNRNNSHISQSGLAPSGSQSSSFFSKWTK